MKILYVTMLAWLAWLPMSMVHAEEAKKEVPQAVKNLPDVSKAPQLPAQAQEAVQGSKTAVPQPQLLIKTDHLLTSLYSVFNENFFNGSLSKSTVVIWTPVLEKNNIFAVVQDPRSKDPRAFAIVLSSFALIGADERLMSDFVVKGMIKIAFIQDTAMKKTDLSEADYEKKEIARIHALQDLIDHVDQSKAPESKADKEKSAPKKNSKSTSPKASTEK